MVPTIALRNGCFAGIFFIINYITFFSIFKISKTCESFKLYVCIKCVIQDLVLGGNEEKRGSGRGVYREVNVIKFS